MEPHVVRISIIVVILREVQRELETSEVVKISEVLGDYASQTSYNKDNFTEAGISS